MQCMDMTGDCMYFGILKIIINSTDNFKWAHGTI